MAPRLWEVWFIFFFYVARACVADPRTAASALPVLGTLHGFTSLHIITPDGEAMPMSNLAIDHRKTARQTANG